MKANEVLDASLPYIIAATVGGCVALGILFAWQGRLQSVLEASPPYLLASGALICFVLTIVRALQDSNISAGVLAAFFVVCVVLAYIPKLDSIAAFSVNVQFRKNLDRQEEIFEQIKALTLVSGKASYTLLAWANRWGGLPNKEKQEIADEINTHLISSGFKDPEIKNIKAQYLGLIGIDIKEFFEQALSIYVIEAARKQGDDQKLLQWSNDWNANKRLSLNKIMGLSGPELARALKAELPGEFLDSEDMKKFERLADQTGEIYAGCIERGGYTTAAINFINEFSSVNSYELLNRVLRRR
jgi:hypothetical protein